MLWDPLNALRGGRKYVWIALGILAIIFQGPRFAQSLRPPSTTGVDFFQDWASIQYFRNGLPVYSDLRPAIKRHLRRSVGKETPVRVTVFVNAHPPTSVLLVIPFGFMTYANAVLAWNVVSLMAFACCLWLIWREMAIPFYWWSVFPLVLALLLCGPFRQQVSQGQMNLLLLLVITGVWIAHRHQHARCAGVFLGFAVAFKLFPAFLFVFFLLRRKWLTVVVGTLTFLLLTAGTVAVLGPEAYADYVNEVMPRVASFRSSWVNASLPGFWTKLFNPDTNQERVVALWRSPAASWILSAVSVLIVTFFVAKITLRSRNNSQEDFAFGLNLVAMLLGPVAKRTLALG